MTGDRRRNLASVAGLGATLVLLSGLAAAGISLLNHWSDELTLEQAVDSAQVISDLVVRSNVEPDQRLGVTTPNLLQVFDIQQDVNRLHAGRRVVGVQVWRVDGTPLFADAGLPPGAELSPEQAERVSVGEPWVHKTKADAGAVGRAATSSRPATLDVYLPYLDSEGRGVAVAKVLLPEQTLTGNIRVANLALRACLALLLAVVLIVVLRLRGRLRTREHQARHDELTGLLNRSALLEDTEQRLRRTGGSQGFALLLVDLDGFKSINDTLGHAAGDLLLHQVGHVLSRAVRGSDLVARLGGDEFAVLLHEVADGDKAAGVAQHVLASMRAESFAVSGVALAVDASIGVAVHPAHGHSVTELLQHADVAMYQSKATHSGVTVYDPDRDHHDVGQLALLLELRQAIEDSQLTLHYQPQIDVRTGVVVGVEALVRWLHPVRGLIGPDAFVPLAEPTGLIHPLTSWVLHAAVAQAGSWSRSGMPLRVSVNISPRSLVEGDLPALVVRELADASLGTELLELEITETAALAEPDRAGEVLRRLRAIGVRVSVDDFGSGYSSLAYLRVLPVSALKLDRGLITDLLDKPEDEAVVDAVIGLGHRLGLDVVAEGVETPAVQDRLRELGCDFAQGYGISRPLPAAALEGWLTAHRSRSHRESSTKEMSR